MDSVLSRILSLMGEKRGSAKRLADYLGIHPNVITNWKSGRNKSYRGYLDELSKYFGVTVDYLKTGKKEKPTTETGDELTDEIIETAKLIEALPPERREVVLQLLRNLADGSKS